MTGLAAGPTQRTLLRRWGLVALPLLAVRLGGQVLEFVGWVLLARSTGAESFGRLAVAFLVCRYTGVVADWGASLQGTRDVAAGVSGAALRSLVRRRRLAGLALSGGVGAGMLALDRPDLLPLVAVVLARALSRDWVALGHHRPVRAGAPLLLQGMVFLGLASTTSLAPAAVIGIAYAGAAVVSVRLNPMPARTDGTDQVRLPTWTMLALLSDQAVASADTLLLGWLHGAATAGIYAAVYRLPNACLAVVGLLATGLLPIVTAQLRDDPRQLPRLTGRLLRASSAGAVLALLAAPLAWWSVPHLLGDEYEAGRVPLLVLFVAIAVTTLTAPLHALFLAAGRPRDYAVIVGSTAALTVAGNLLVLPSSGMVGAACMTLVAQLLLFGQLRRGLRQLEVAG